MLATLTALEWRVLAEVGAVDSTWKNDTCPSFTVGPLKVYCEEPDPVCREWSEEPRFNIYETDSEGVLPCEPVKSVETITELLDALALGWSLS
jgi:hypothetical protein